MNNMRQTRIELGDNMQTTLYKMSSGNPGALMAMLSIMKHTEVVDPQSLMGPFSHLLNLDSFGIYDDKIYMLYNDICNRNPVYAIAALRAVQLGIISESVLISAINNGENIDIKDLLFKVRQELSEFTRENTVE
jgi:hypothetical protein